MYSVIPFRYQKPRPLENCFFERTCYESLWPILTFLDMTHDVFFAEDSQNVVIVQGLLMVTERLHLLCLRSFPTHFWRSCLHALILKCSHTYLRSTNCKNACSSTDNETHRTVWTCTCLYRLDMLMMNFFLTGLVGTSSLPKSCTDK